jgi:hypothetical protein
MRGTGVHHFDLVVSSLDPSLPLYRMPGHYDGFFRDPDGPKLEIVHVPTRSGA